MNPASIESGTNIFCSYWTWNQYILLLLNLEPIDPAPIDLESIDSDPVEPWISASKMIEVGTNEVHSTPNNLWFFVF